LLRFVPGFPLLSGIASADELLSCATYLTLSHHSVFVCVTTEPDQKIHYARLLDAAYSTPDGSIISNNLNHSKKSVALFGLQNELL